MKIKWHIENDKQIVSCYNKHCEREHFELRSLAEKSLNRTSEMSNDFINARKGSVKYSLLKELDRIEIKLKEARDIADDLNLKAGDGNKVLYRNTPIIDYIRRKESKVRDLYNNARRSSGNPISAYGKLANPIVSNEDSWPYRSILLFDNGLHLSIESDDSAKVYNADFSALEDTTFDTSDFNNMEFESIDNGIRVNKYFVPVDDCSDHYYSGASDFSMVLKDGKEVVLVLAKFTSEDSGYMLGIY